MLGKSGRNVLSEIIQCIVSNIFSPFIRKNPLTVFINGNFVYFENICSIYSQNKKILLNKSDVFLSFLINIFLMWNLICPFLKIWTLNF